MLLPKLAALTAAAALMVATTGGCGGGSDDEPTPTTASATTNADGTTAPGTELDLGKSAVVDVQADQKHRAMVSLSVTKVEKGKLKDLHQFQLNQQARESTIYYVSTKVKNLGPDALSGAKITLYGKVSDDLVVPPVKLRSSFPRCDYTALPKGFSKNDAAKGCMVILAPKHGKISEIQWRAPDDSEPISWIVTK